METLLTPAVTISVVMGLVEVAKRTGLGSRFLPLLAVALGVGSFFLGFTDSVLIGLAVGLSSVGLFSGARAASGN